MPRVFCYSSPSNENVPSAAIDWFALSWLPDLDPIVEVEGSSAG